MDEKDWIAGAAKALAIIEAFDEEHARMTPTTVAARESVAYGGAPLSAHAA
ncbi:MAG: Transcriptional regulator, IclR family [uncultured Paraburkholderia sp.]|nr:MAG: Transcriptional regulator, IclR family [uncultured Paraburkholderia sp.]CAH2922953.1 MAG: Transcriptional regulator, IclR family [uncultured Paraburkholderia sp.]